MRLMMKMGGLKGQIALKVKEGIRPAVNCLVVNLPGWRKRVISFHQCNRHQTRIPRRARSSCFLN